MTTLPKAVLPVWSANESPGFASRRLQREFKTISAMVRIYCRDHHREKPCLDCGDLLAYARLRLERCRFGAEKPTCARCPVHCYQRDRREQVRTVMRYAGPRMLWEHPLLSLHHWLDWLFRRQNLTQRPEGAKRD